MVEVVIVLVEWRKSKAPSFPSLAIVLTIAFLTIPIPHTWRPSLKLYIGERKRVKTRKDSLVLRVFCQYTTKTKYGPWLSAFDMNTLYEQQEDDTISNFGALYEQQEDDASMMCLMLQ